MEPMQVDVVEENHNVEEEQNYNVENPTVVRCFVYDVKIQWHFHD